MAADMRRSAFSSVDALRPVAGHSDKRRITRHKAVAANDRCQLQEEMRDVHASTDEVDIHLRLAGKRHFYYAIARRRPRGPRNVGARQQRGGNGGVLARACGLE
jgi:hypothetical protein